MERVQGAEIELKLVCKMLQGHFIKLVPTRSISPTKASPHTWLTKAEMASLNCLARARVIGPWGSTIESLLELDALQVAIVSLPSSRGRADLWSWEIFLRKWPDLRTNHLQEEGYDAIPVASCFGTSRRHRDWPKLERPKCKMRPLNSFMLLE